jgi:RND family efflux transporter MFP subunit
MTTPAVTKVTTEKPPEKPPVHIRPPRKHKKLIWIVLIALVVAGYFGLQMTKGSENIPRYTLEAVTKGNLIVSVTGSGQVGVSSKVEIKPKVSGEVLSLNVVAGQEVKTGEVIAKIDSKDAAKTVRNASIALQNAQISLDKIKKPSDDYTISEARSSVKQAEIDLKKLTDPPTELDLISAQNSVAQAERDLAQSKNNLSKTGLTNTQEVQKTYDDGFTAVSNAFLELPQLLKDSYKVQWDDDAAENLKNRIPFYQIILTTENGVDSIFVTNLQTDFTTASKIMDTTFAYFKTVTRNADITALYQLIKETNKTVKAVSNSLESGRNILDAYTYNGNYKDYALAAETDRLKTTIIADIGTINKHVTALQNAKDAIDSAAQNTPIDLISAQNSITASEENLAIKKASLKKLTDGATAEDIMLAQEKVKQQQESLNKILEGSDALDIKSSELNVKDKQNALYDANQTFADYTVTAPFDCIIAVKNINKGDTISSGTSIATVITKQQIAELSLNEVDVAKIKVGQKATMTFDAFDTLTITGHVAEIDTLGTVSQGVVTYNVKIAFDTQDERIKPGMSTSASIITDIGQDVILAPNGAIKTNGTSYVERIENPITNIQNTNDTTVTSLTAPTQVEVVTGLANDTYTEITSGLSEGDKIVTKTSNGKTTTTTTGTSGAARGLSLPGMGGGRGG